MSDAKREHIALHDRAQSVEIFGDLVINENGCRVAGIANGLTEGNYLEFRPTELDGISSERGQIWLERIFNVSRTVSGEGKRPSTVTFKALTAYWGGFDTRETLIERASISLEKLESLSTEKLTETSFSNEDNTFLSRSRLRATPFELFKNDEITLSIDYMSSIGHSVTHEQILFATFNQPATLERVNCLFDMVMPLILLLTQSRFPESIRSFYTSKSTAYQWRAESMTSEIRDPYHWLQNPGSILSTLQEMLPSWIRNLAQERALSPVNTYLSASAPSVYLESRFLSYCQCFEELSRRRFPGMPMPSEEFERRVVEPLKSAFESLKEAGIEKSLRRKLLWSIKQTNGFSLKERMARTFDVLPSWLIEAMEFDKDIFGRIEKRRNQLSYGNPEGVILSPKEAERLNTESSVISLHCLAEILFLGGLDEAQVTSMVDASETASDIQWSLKNSNHGER